MTSKVMHRAGPISAWAVNQSLPAFTLCGKILNWNGANCGAPPCPKCEKIAARKGWKPIQH